jgi:hypothetical protein
MGSESVSSKADKASHLSPPGRETESPNSEAMKPGIGDWTMVIERWSLGIRHSLFVIPLLMASWFLN